MVDGADNNDDVVGGPSAEHLAGSGAGVPDRHEPLLRRDRPVRPRRSSTSSRSPARTTFTGRRRSSAETTSCRRLPGDVRPRLERWTRPSIASSYSVTAGGPLVKDTAWWFGAFEYRNQDGAMLVGTRNTATRPSCARFAAAPLDDALGSRFRGSTAVRRKPSSVFVRYAGTKATDAAAELHRPRPIGSASQRQTVATSTTLSLGTWTRIMSPTLDQCRELSVQPFRNEIAPVAARPTANVSEHTGRLVVRRAQGTTQRRFQLPIPRRGSRGPHT